MLCLRFLVQLEMSTFETIFQATGKEKIEAKYSQKRFKGHRVRLSPEPLLPYYTHTISYHTIP